MKENLDVEILGHVARLKFSNAPVNFATVRLLRLIADELERLDQQPEIRAIVLAAEGKVFCAGADLVSPNGFGASSADPLREFYDQAIRIYASRKPIIAAVQGAAIGAGLGLAIAADFRVAAPEAKFSANFTKLGFHPGFALTYTLPRLIGDQHASRMFLTAERYSAGQCADWGLVDKIVSADQLQASALGLAREIAVNAPLALLSTRATLRGNLAGEVKTRLFHEHQQQLLLQPTEDFAEGVRASAERRPASFKGR
jgi:enoyl-CoA hydratase/carnithine racemase